MTTTFSIISLSSVEYPSPSSTAVTAVAFFKLTSPLPWVLVALAAYVLSCVSLILAEDTPLTCSTN